jgi:hypothetical protein
MPDRPRDAIQRGLSASDILRIQTEVTSELVIAPARLLRTEEMTLNDSHQHYRVDHPPAVTKVGYVLWKLRSHEPPTGSQRRREPDRRNDRTTARGNRQHKPGQHISQVQRVALTEPPMIDPASIQKNTRRTTGQRRQRPKIISHPHLTLSTTRT